MRKWIWSGAILLFVAAFFIWLNQDEEQTTSPPNEEVATSSADEQRTDEQPEEEKTIKEEIKEAVSSVLEGAKDLFVKDDLNIVAIGDSLTQGVGDESDNGGYVGVLEDTLQKNNEDLEITNYGKRGNRTDQLLKRLKNDDISSSIEEADIIVMTIGANDIMKVVKGNFTSLTYEDFETELPKYEKRLSDIFQTIRSKNEEAPIYLVGLFNPFQQYFSDIPELDQIIYEWNQTSKEVVGRYPNSEYVPIKDLFNGASENLYSEDNFHPNIKGYRLMAERILSHMKDEMIRQQEEEI